MYRPARVCSRCKKAVPSGVRCDCTPEPRAADPRNVERAKPYSSPEWKALRAAHLKHNRTCTACCAPASVVDHVRAWKGNQALFLDPSNLQSLCRSCHSKKTASQDGGFGNPTEKKCGCDTSGNPLDPSHPWFVSQ
ncbi:HNH endonuclease signature motif containing protein [Elstera cyanobacteriorum]